MTLGLKPFLFALLILLSFHTGAAPLQEKELGYEPRLESLKKGDFQYFFRILQPKGEYNELLETFMPLDVKNLWDPKDGNHLAVTKLNYVLPIDIKNINKERFISVGYLQKTIPDYQVTKLGDYFQVSGSIFTPGFRLSLKYLAQDNPLLNAIKGVDLKKVRTGKMKVFFQHQDKFGRVMFFKTAKMASAATIYEEVEPGQTLVTQYILSNVVNVPAKALLQREMIKNMQTMVKGSRLAVKDF